MVTYLKELIPEFSHFEELELKYNREIAGYQTVLILKSGFPFAGGLHEELNTARRICAAEAIERAVVFELRAQISVEDPFALNTVSSTCGFAAGFEKEPTVFRSICEAAERWAWSKWIDEGIAPTRVNLPINRPLQKCLAGEFDDIYFYMTEVEIKKQGLPAFMPERLQFLGAVGVKGHGIFPGARVSAAGDDLLTHSIVEAWRHLKIYENELKLAEPTTRIDSRIKMFGSNGKATLAAINRLKPSRLPMMTLEFVKMVRERDGYVVSRALASDYRPWDEGPHDRFVY